MRKKVFGRQLGRARKSRKALFRALIRALVEHGSIKTTKAKAKAVVPMVEKLVRLSKKGDLAARRRVQAELGNDKITANKLVEQFSGGKRKSGFCRIVELPVRRGDRAQMVRLELIVDKEVRAAHKEEKRAGGQEEKK
jgi:large subunit ribosomal protein L17